MSGPNKRFVTVCMFFQSHNRRNVMIGTNFQRLVSSHKNTNGAIFSMLQQFDFTDSSFLPFWWIFNCLKSIQLGSSANSTQLMLQSNSWKNSYTLISSSSSSSNVFTSTSGKETIGLNSISGDAGSSDDSDLVLSLDTSSPGFGGTKNGSVFVSDVSAIGQRMFWTSGRKKNSERKEMTDNRRLSNRVTSSEHLFLQYSSLQKFGLRKIRFSNLLLF